MPDGVAVAVKVQPKSRRPGLQGLAPSADGERLRIGVTEAAEDGRANRAACAALAGALGAGAVGGASDARRDQPGEDAARRRRPRGARREAGCAVSARIIDGKAVAAALRARLAEQVAALPFRPGLAVVLVGDDPASAVYVRSKDRAANAVGIAARTIRLPADTSEQALITQIARLNADPAVDGILVQLPLPPHITSQAVIEAIDPDKDVDGFHPLNVGRLATGHPGLVPCTPAGVMKLLAEADASAGRRARPGAGSLHDRRAADGGAAARRQCHRHHGALAHPRSRRRVPARGHRRGRRGQAGAGAWRLDRAWRHGDRRRRSTGFADGRLVGDVAFAEAVQVAGAITPVPGGVGPMTIACLLENTVTAALRRRSGS